MRFNYKWCNNNGCNQVCSYNKEKLTTMSTNEEENGKESKEPDYDEEENQLEERQEEETGELDKQETTN